MAGVIEVSHPLIENHLARLRDKSTGPAEFRLLIQRLAVLLAYEATKDLELAPVEVETRGPHQLPGAKDRRSPYGKRGGQDFL